MSNYKQLCTEIMKDVGGKENITFVTHCMTRLRMNLKDKSLVNEEAIQNIRGVLGCQFSGGQFQVIIGQHVSEVYKEFQEMCGLNSASSAEDQISEKEPFSWKQVPNKIIDAVSGCVTPILPIITATGIIKLIYALLGPGMLNLLSTESDFMVLMNFVGNAGFYFFPVFTAWAAAKKFNTSIPIAMFLGAVLIHPTLLELVASGNPFTVYGLPMTLVNYSSQFLPSILIVWIMSYVYRFFEKITPNSLKIIVIPTATMLVMLPVALVAVGPLANLIGQGLAGFFTGMYQLTGPLAIGLIGAVWYFLVATGMHQALIALATTMIATMGSDSIILVGSKSGSYALMGLAIAYLIRCAKEDKAIASANAVTLLVGGISEPTIFSMLLRYKSAMLVQIIAGFIGGVINGLFHVSIYFFGPTNILTGLAFGQDLVYGMIGCTVSFIVALVLGLLVGFDNSKISFHKRNKAEKNTPDSKNNTRIDKSTTVEPIYAPVSGKIVPLSEVNDQAFASGSLGEGIAVLPEENKVYAPFDGEVTMIFPTKHALGLRSVHGTEVLIHIGIDTVNDQGKSFKVFVHAGDQMHKGDLLVDFDMNSLNDEGYDLTTSVLLSEGGQATNLGTGTIRHGQVLMNADRCEA